VKERRRGALGRATGLAESIGANVRRLQRDRESRVLLYDALGEPRVLQPSARGYDHVIEVCERMVGLVDTEPPAGTDGRA
jgi:hypothetical protein